jgi:hypothetical protein
MSTPLPFVRLEHFGPYTCRVCGSPAFWVEGSWVCQFGDREEKPREAM